MNGVGEGRMKLFEEDRGRNRHVEDMREGGSFLKGLRVRDKCTLYFDLTSALMMLSTGPKLTGAQVFSLNLSTVHSSSPCGVGPFILYLTSLHPFCIVHIYYENYGN